MPGPENPDSSSPFSEEEILIARKLEDPKPRSIAAIDIGSNSTHLLVASINPILHTFSIELAEKSTTRLGDREEGTRKLSDTAMDRVFETLKRFKELSQSYRVEKIVIAATSAVREAPNGRQFLSEIKEKLSLEVDLVSGLEEARLIYLGVLSSMEFGDKPHLILDIGGGSTELILADGCDAKALTSTKIGAVRLQKEFIKEDPISIQSKEFLEAFIRGSLEPAVDKVLGRLRKDLAPVLVATSGTAMAIGSLIANEDSSRPIKLHGYKVTIDQLEKLIQKLIKLPLEQRRKLTPLNERRAEIIIPGALILHSAMKMLSVHEFTLCERALREGLIFDWMMRNDLLRDRFSFQSSIRTRTVIHQVQRFAVDKQRAERVANFALTLYDFTYGTLHTDQGEGRQLLWAASMLHSCGQQINISAYHKHSWYLIRHGELLGYSDSEHLIIAAIARYHRRSLPKKRHECWQALVKKENRQLVFEMSLLLRMASAIDRRPDSAVNSIVVNTNSNELIIKLIPQEEGTDLGLEKWSLNNCIDLFRENMPVKIIVLS